MISRLYLALACGLAMAAFAAAPAAADPGPPPPVQDCGSVTFSKKPLSDGRILGRYMACREARRIVKDCGIRGRLRSGWKGERSAHAFKLRRDDQRSIHVALYSAMPRGLDDCLQG
jgi:hypothetical protein